MEHEISRRDFMKTTAIGTMGAAALGMLSHQIPGLYAEAAVKPDAPDFEGRKKFAGIHNSRKISDDLIYLGANDRRIALFENVYPVPRGVSYNSYLLLDEKTVLFDTVDRSASGQFFENLTYALDGRPLDYFIINHMEPDHCSAITEVMVRYPNVELIFSETARKIISQFFHFDPAEYGHSVKEGDTLSTGKHTLTFLMAPMVHWPEVMMTYDITSKTLFSADAFGTFGALNGNLFADQVPFETEWLDDARRYYCNIVGKYGPQVQAVLKKASTVEIKTICPLHGPIWRENLGWILEKYDLWSSYTPEDKDGVMVVYGSIYGGTENAANVLASELSMGGIPNVKVYDVSKTHVSELIAEAFRCSHIVFASITYNMGIFTPMKNFIMDLAAHNMQNRRFALVQNGSWSPVSGKLMKELLDQMPNMTQIGDTVTITSTTDETSYQQLDLLADQLIASLTNAASPAAAAAPAPVSKWRCPVCGYIYEGDDMPAGYTCPLCGVPGTAFQKVE